jgi:hypothetical protein
MVSATASLYSMIALSDCARDEMRGGSGAASSQGVVERPGPGDSLAPASPSFHSEYQISHYKSREVLPYRTPRIS